MSTNKSKNVKTFKAVVPKQMAQVSPNDQKKVKMVNSGVKLGNNSNPNPQISSSPPKKASNSKNPSKRIAKNLLKGHNVTSFPGAGEMVASFASPRDFPVCRIPSPMTSFPTAVANPFYRLKPSWTDTPLSSSVDTTFAACFRDQCRSLVQAVDATPGYRYTTPNFSVSVGTTVSGLQPPAASWTSGGKVHGGVLFPGRLQGSTRYYFYAESPATISIINNFAINLTLIPYYYYQGSLIPQAQINIAPAATGVYAAPAVAYGSYIGFDILGGSAASGFITMYINRASGAPQTCFGHFALPFAAENLASVDAAKIYGVSLMYTNDASPLNRQGKIAGVQVPRGRDWRDYATYDDVASLNTSCSMNAENGLFGFLKPTQPEDFNFVDEDVFENASLDKAYFDISPNSDFLVIAVNVQVTAGQDGYFTAAWALEYRTVDQWRDSQVSMYPMASTDVAIKLISMMPQWHENPLHIDDIANWISDKAEQGYKWLQSTVPKVAGAAKTAVELGELIAPFFL